MSSSAASSCPQLSHWSPLASYGHTPCQVSPSALAGGHAACEISLLSHFWRGSLMVPTRSKELAQVLLQVLPRKVLCACAYLIAALGTCSRHQAVRQEFARRFTIQLHAFLLFQLPQLLQPIEDRLQHRSKAHFPMIIESSMCMSFEDTQGPRSFLLSSLKACL